MLIESILIATVTVAGVIVQTVAGLGFLLLLTPILLIYFDPVTAISISLSSGCVLSGLMLLKEKRNIEVSSLLIIGMFISSLPGIALGVWFLTEVPKEILQIIVGVAIIVTALVQQYVFPEKKSKLRFSKSTLVSGFFAGVMNASTSMGGPALAIWLRSRIITPNQFRNTLAVMFLLLNTTSLALIQVESQFSFDSQGLFIFLLLIPVIIMSHSAGKKLTTKMQKAHFHLLILLVIIAAGLMSIGLGLSKL